MKPAVANHNSPASPMVTPTPTNPQQAGRRRPLMPRGTRLAIGTALLLLGVARGTQFGLEVAAHWSEYSTEQQVYEELLAELREDCREEVEKERRGEIRDEDMRFVGGSVRLVFGGLVRQGIVASLLSRYVDPNSDLRMAEINCFGVIRRDSISKFTHFHELRTLSFRTEGANLSEFKSLARLEHLEELNIYDTDVSGLGVLGLAQLQSLRRLNLFRCTIDETEAAWLRASLPQCDIVEVSQP